MAIRLARNFHARPLNSSAFCTTSDQVFDVRARLRILHCFPNGVADLPTITGESHEVRFLAQIVVQFIEGDFRLDLTLIQAAYGSFPEFSHAVCLNDDGVLDHGDALSGRSVAPNEIPSVSIQCIRKTRPCLSGLVPVILTNGRALRTREVVQVEGERPVRDLRSALRLLTSSALFLPVRKKRSLVNRGSSRDPEIKSQNRAPIERRRALFPGSQSTSSGM